ncbi:cytochrome P450 [Aspergillus brunneoviolaceus CBS 621.78]|uniref:Cytochrome P450 n=1 Tax=Aspergillus brunneoviolaceus CBS 621.78 TaxID=1450534 RepID=A0ACD1FW42_9EURO|nr:cytochrome P450 [Aspergillus brunneoviolaceus CBS 621.78]RAH41200.1 cytochrome P450 [Aspergillus brunneoviolaceus CBS 621.78]
MFLYSGIALGLVLAVIFRQFKPHGGKEPPSLSGWMITNTYQYMTDMHGFLQRVASAQCRSNIIKFRLGPKKIYMVSGEKNIQAINTPSHSISPEVFFLDVMANVWGAKPAELVKFRQDKSGRRKNPIPGHELPPGEPRLWHGQHHIYSEFLQRTDRANFLTTKYFDLFSDRLVQQPLNEWREVRLCEFFESEMAEAALEALMGPRLVELNPGFWPTMWEFARIAPQLMWGLPRWMNPGPWKTQADFQTMCRRYIDAAAKAFDPTGPEADAEWEPQYGSRMARELVKWATENLSPETTAGMVATFIFGTNANSVPMSTWALMHLVADPALYRAVRDECLAASTTDPITGRRGFDPQKLFGMPLLQSVYIETLRLHVSINVTREVTQPITLDGFLLTPGSLIQAPSQIGQYNEGVWSAPGHPASEFWGYRNLKRESEKPEFTMTGKTSSFFPFGGGPSICPGRVFAKQEILMTIAALVTRFEIELIDWIHPDGTRSDRPAQNDQSLIGAVGIPPDRDMKVRWKRLW